MGPQHACVGMVKGDGSGAGELRASAVLGTCVDSVCILMSTDVVVLRDAWGLEGVIWLAGPLFMCVVIGVWTRLHCEGGTEVLVCWDCIRVLAVTALVASGLLIAVGGRVGVGCMSTCVFVVRFDLGSGGLKI